MSLWRLAVTNLYVSQMYTICVYDREAFEDLSRRALCARSMRAQFDN